MTAAAEFNVWADPEAAQAVFASTLPTVLVGLDVTMPTVLDEVDIARFAAAGPIGAQAAAILQQYLDHARAAYGTTGVVVHDALALTEAIRPGFLGTTRRDVVVDTGLGAGRGQTLVDRAVSAAPTAVEVAEGVDSAAAVEFLVSRLAGLDRRRRRGSAAERRGARCRHGGRRHRGRLRCRHPLGGATGPPAAPAGPPRIRRRPALRIRTVSAASGRGGRRGPPGVEPLGSSSCASSPTGTPCVRLPGRACATPARRHSRGRP